MSSTYAQILRRPGAWQFSLAGLLARFPMSMVGISTILAIAELYDSYSVAGRVSAANIVAAAVGAPLLARLVDARGQAAVMLPAALVSCAALVGLIVASINLAPLWILMVLSALAGGLSGSMGSLVRARWTAAVSTPKEIHTAFSLEAALDEVSFMIGPVLATALCTSSLLPVTSGWIAAVALQLGGGVWLLLQRATEPPVHSRADRRRRRASGGLDGDEAADAGRGGHAAAEQALAPVTPILRNGAVVCVIAVFLVSGAMFGANDVTAVAFATELGQKDLAGIALAAWAGGSFLAALAYGMRAWSWPLWKQLALGTVWLALGSSLFQAAPNLVVLSILYVLAGLGTAPTITAGNNVVRATVAPSQLTEGLSWISTSLNIGVSLGSMAAGYVLDAGGAHQSYLFVAGFAWAAVLALVAGLPVLRRARTRADLTGR